MRGLFFTHYVPPPEEQAGSFEQLLKMFLQLLQYTAGDAAEALDWLNQLDNQYGLTGEDYGMGDFIQDLMDQGYLTQEPGQQGAFALTARSEQAIRSSALEEIFGKLKRGGPGQHRSNHTGQSEDPTGDLRPFEFGDALDRIQMTESIRNAQVNHGFGAEFRLTERDLQVAETEYKTSVATVLMIDISHSMILYGEDRITPAKKVAMALVELIQRKYPKDTIDILVFGNDAWPITIQDLPYLKVGPYHTNTVAGLELALDLLRRRKTPNKQIFMITDGKPTCLKQGKGYYKNSFGLDRRIVSRTLTLAAQARRLRIPITTFMIAQDPYLQSFVHQFTETNQGRAFYSSLDGLGQYIFQDFLRNRRRSAR